METQKCSKCRTNKLFKFFKFRENTGKYYKTCVKCSEKHKCELCDLKFSTKSHLTRHIKSVHDKIKDNECDQCDYKCSTASNLTEHIKIVHDKIKDNECDQCDYKCSTNSCLTAHIKIVHDKIKDNECDQCSYKCSRNGDLTKHIKNCTGSRNISSGEYQMIKALADLGFIEDQDYTYNKSHTPLTNWSGKYLRFDFLFEDQKTAMEYDGRQHDTPVCFGGISKEQAEENFQETHANDKLKNDFCTEHDYKMIRISYKDFPRILSILSDELFDIVDWTG